MSYRNLESKVEAAVKSAIDAVIAASATLTGYGITVRGFWPTGAAKPPPNLPAIDIAAAPNAPTGYRSAKRDIGLTVTLATAHGDDPNQIVIGAIYDAVRAILDETTITDAELSQIAVTIESGSQVEENPEINLVQIACVAHVDATLITTTTTTTT